MAILSGNASVKTGNLIVDAEGKMVLDVEGEGKLPIAESRVIVPPGTQMRATVRLMPSAGGYSIERLTPVEVAGTFAATISVVSGPFENRKFGGNYCIVWFSAEGMLDPFGKVTDTLRGASFPLYLNLDGKGEDGVVEPSIEVMEGGVVILRRKFQDVVRALFPEAFTEDCKFVPTDEDYRQVGKALLNYLVSTFPKAFKITVTNGKVTNVATL